MVWPVKTYPAQSTGLESKNISSGGESVFLDFPFYRTDISTRFHETSELPVNRPATMECQGEKPTLWGPTREYQCFYDVQSQGVEREICECTNAQDEFKRDA